MHGAPRALASAHATAVSVPVIHAPQISLLAKQQLAFVHCGPAPRSGARQPAPPHAHTFAHCTRVLRHHVSPSTRCLGAPQVQGRKVISDKHARDFVEEQKKRGIIYLSRIPRFMKPVTVRQLLARYGEVTRIYIVPEESAVRAARVRKGGSRRENWIEGWVEYADKQTAKLVASQLNTTPVDPKGKGLYGGELWTMKYLSGFKWAHLKEKLAYEKRMRASKVRQSVANVRAETEDYKTRTEISKRLQRQGAGESAAAAGDSMGGVKRSFNQLTPLDAEGRAVMGFTSVAEDGFERGDAGRRGGDVAPDVLAAVFGGQRSGSHKKPRRKAASA